MSDRKQIVKYAIMSSLAILVIAINLFMFFAPDNRVTQETKNINYLEFYDKEFPEMNLTNRNNEIWIPNNKNLLLLGVNNQFDKYLEPINKVYNKLGMLSYDCDILLLTRKNLPKNKYNIKLYNYYNVQFEDFFKLDADDNFTILIEKNKVKYYKAHIIDFMQIKSMLEKFKVQDF